MVPRRHANSWSRCVVPSDLARLRERVFARDRYSCLAPILDPLVDACRGPFNTLATYSDGTYRYSALTLEHVHEQPGMRRVHQDDHCLTLCYWHNVESGWSQSHREQENAHLDALYGAGRRIAT